MAEYGVHYRTPEPNGKMVKFTSDNDVDVSGDYALTFTITAATNVTLPTTGTLLTAAGEQTLTNKTLTAPTITTPTITLGTINNTTIGATTPTTGVFTTLTGTTANLTTANVTTLVVATQTPASAAAAGVAGTIAWDGGFLYVCTATNTWERVAIATW